MSVGSQNIQGLSEPGNVRWLWELQWHGCWNFEYWWPIFDCLAYFKTIPDDKAILCFKLIYLFATTVYFSSQIGVWQAWHYFDKLTWFNINMIRKKCFTIKIVSNQEIFFQKKRRKKERKNSIGTCTFAARVVMLQTWKCKINITNPSIIIVRVIPIPEIHSLQGLQKSVNYRVRITST